MSIEITENTLTPEDLELVKQAIALKQKEMNRPYIPSDVIFQVVKGKLSSQLEENNFKSALAKVLAAKRMPGYIPQKGRTGGIGPEKKTNDSTSMPVPSPAPLPVAEMVIQETVEVSSPTPSSVVVETTSSIISEEVIKSQEEAPLKIEELQAVVESVKPIPEKKVIEKPQFKKPIPLLPPEEFISEDNKIWNQERAEAFILAFADAIVIPGERNFFKSRAKDESVSSSRARALFRVATGFDPAKVSIIGWDSLFDISEKKTG